MTILTITAVNDAWQLVYGNLSILVSTPSKLQHLINCCVIIIIIIIIITIIIRSTNRTESNAPEVETETNLQAFAAETGTTPPLLTTLLLILLEDGCTTDKNNKTLEINSK